ncbi:fasciclin domain-containing protein [Candidatus Mycosynbacter amalyticus]|uniref:Fasciclin domain-containing protein n=1 Tax=Candidatus Mycosynbacter amalyticus TaxID=2665156 RepID=A0A857MRX8_9BACT|nr:fasciclin domain-containing protein [Candidatus Mycosynbacter amalyticus]
MLGGMKMDSNKNSTTTQMSSANSEGGDGVTVGGAKMVRDKDIVDNAAQAKNVTTLVSLVKKADLVDTLKGEGPFTVFGPNNDAFAKLDKATVESLQKPENKDMLAKILTYHVVSGTYTSADLKAMAAKGEMLTSVEGEMLTPVMDGGELKIQDAKGNKVSIETADVISSNGVTHVVNAVLMPNS